MTIHTFNKSQEWETMTSHVHALRYQQLYPNIQIEPCDFNADIGKMYQKADTDIILKNGVKVSEKSRKRNFNDLYLEVISQLTIDYGYATIKAPGWATELDHQYGPDAMSYLSQNVDRNNDFKGFSHIFIKDYKLLKNSLFINTGLRDYIQSNEFLFLLKNDMTQNNYLSFQIKQGNSINSIRDLLYHNLSVESDIMFNKETALNQMSIICAKNLNYTTIGLSIPTYLVKKILPQNTFEQVNFNENLDLIVENKKPFTGFKRYSRN